MNKKYIIYIIIAQATLLFSQSFQSIEKLKNEYKKVLEQQSLQKSQDITDAEKTAQSTALPDKLIYSRKDIESLLVNTEKLLEKLKFIEDSSSSFPYAGYEIFTQRDTIPFWQNLPIPQDYILGPGDEIIIALWGESESYDNQIINRDGQIFLKDVGVLNISGKTIRDVKQYIISKYSRIYSTLIGDSPKSFIDITLGELKSVNVHFVGFVNIPGVHMIHPFSNIITGLTQAGGVNNKGSLRQIQIIRKGNIIGEIDIYNYIMFGKSIGDIRLLDQDIIFVPPRNSTIALSGLVKMPGYYEILNGESINDLLNISGGKNFKSSNRLFYYNKNFNEKAYLLKDDETFNYLLSDGDSIHVPIRSFKDNFVFIEGQIKNSGKYPFQINMNLKELIDATMSVNDSDFMKTVDLKNIIINRINPTGLMPITIAVNLSIDNITLENGDHITIPRSLNNQPIEPIIITGEVMTPGIYPVNNLTTLGTVLSMAGGYTENAIINGVEVFRDSLKIAWGKDSFMLSKGDSINVLKKTGLVLIDGEVNVPGYLSYKKGSSVKKYIKRAGGFSAFANPKDIFIIHPNGTAIPLSRWNSPKVLEGSKIIINQVALSGYSNKSANLQSISNVASNFATTLITLILLYNQTNGT